MNNITNNSKNNIVSDTMLSYQILLQCFHNLCNNDLKRHIDYYFNSNNPPVI